MANPSPDLLADLRRDEGLRLTAYEDTVGVWTVGYGHAHVPPGTVWTKAQAELQLRRDAENACRDMDDRLPWWRDLDQVRQDALANMCFNLGVAKLLGFKTTLSLLQDGDYSAAAQNCLKSLWARQVGDRAKRIAHMIETGERPA
jgi:lysozyme